MEQMTRVQQNTLRKIVEAAIELMSEKGFHRVSVQEVGKKAGICEKTVFRYFATKKSLLDEIIRYREYASELKKEFENRKTWDLAHDLKLAARLYFQATKAKRNAFRAYLSALDSVDTNGDDFLRDRGSFIPSCVTTWAPCRKKERSGRGMWGSWCAPLSIPCTATC